MLQERRRSVLSSAMKEAKRRCQWTTTKAPAEGLRRVKKKKKARPSKREALDDDFVTAIERKKPQGPPEGAIFDKMLKEPCPYHKGGANHKLEDCRILKRYFDGLRLKKDDQGRDKSDDKGGNKEDEGFPAVHDCYMIYGGPSTQLTMRQRKRECRKVFAASMAVPQYLNWSSTPITFNRDDHPDRVVAPASTRLSSIPSSSTLDSRRY
jgi:hypothetical protein